MNFNKIQIIENFGNGNKIINNIDYSASASFESNDRVNTSMMVESLTSVINNAVNDVKQNNLAEASALSAATNNLSVMGLTAKTFLLSNVTQVAETNVIETVSVEQKNVATIINTMDTSIQQQITKESNISDTINEINKNNQEALQASLDAIPPVPNVPKQDARKHVNSFFGGGNKTTNNIDVDYESSVKKMLDIDDSVKISENSNTKNELFNTITSANYSNCQINALAKNAITLLQIDAQETATITNISQTSKADVNLKCAFSQTNITNIANKMVTQISSTINNLYKGIQSKPDSTKYDFLHNLGAAISDQVISASGKVPPNYISSSQPASTQPSIIDSFSKNNNQILSATQPINNQQSSTQPVNNQQTPTNQQDNVYIYMVFGVIIFILLIALIIFILKK